MAAVQRSMAGSGNPLVTVDRSILRSYKHIIKLTTAFVALPLSHPARAAEMPAAGNFVALIPDP